MTGATLSTSVDATEAARAFAALKGLMADTTPVMKAIGVGLVRDTQDRFMDAVDPEGKPWQALSPGYAPIKKGPGILRAAGMRGGLMGSITSRVGPDTVEVGTNKVYGAVHQFGATIHPKNASHLVFEMAGGIVKAKSVTIPARSYLGVGPTDERTILETVVDALDRQLARSIRQAPNKSL